MAFFCLAGVFGRFTVPVRQIRPWGEFGPSRRRARRVGTAQRLFRVHRASGPAHRQAREASPARASRFLFQHNQCGTFPHIPSLQPLVALRLRAVQPYSWLPGSRVNPSLCRQRKLSSNKDVDLGVTCYSRYSAGHLPESTYVLPITRLLDIKYL